MSEVGDLDDPRDALRKMQTWEEFNSMAGQPTLITYREVFGEPASHESLVAYMNEFGAAGILGGIAKLGWFNDKSVDEGRVWHRRVGEAIDKDFETHTASMIDHGRFLLSRMSISKLVEILTYCSATLSEAAVPTFGQMGRMLLASNELCDAMNASYPEIDLVKAYSESSSPAELQHRIDELDDDQFRDWVVDFAANQQAAFLHYRHDIVETLAPAFLDTWRMPFSIDGKRWPGATCMADIFSKEIGFDVFEYASAGLQLYRRAREGNGRLLMGGELPLLSETPLGEEMRRRASVELRAGMSELRDVYSQQQYPIISFGGEHFVPDSQKLLRRFLEAPVELDLLSSIAESGRRAEVKRLLESRFEARVNNRLERIVRHCRDATLYSEKELQSHFLKKAGRKQAPSCCDWVLSARHASIYFEATKRALPFSVIGPGGSGQALGNDFEKNYVKRKFRQIASTFDGEVLYGLPGGGPRDSPRVHFGFVVLPRVGLASETSLEVILRSSVGEYLSSGKGRADRDWLPIGILNESDLTLLEGWAEHRRVDVSRLLYDWRLAAVQNAAPLSLEDFAESRGLDRPMPSRDLKRAAFFRKLYVAGD